MRINTRSYQSDFERDRETLMDAAANADTVPLRDRIYLWMSRSCGTWCVKEKDVFLEPTCAHTIWSYYADETSQRILAYVVEVMGIEDKKAVGNLYPLEYRKHVDSVKHVAIPADRIGWFMKRESVSKIEISLSVRKMVPYLAGTDIRSMCQMTEKHGKLRYIRRNESVKRCGVERLRSISGNLRDRQ